LFFLANEKDLLGQASAKAAGIKEKYAHKISPLIKTNLKSTQTYNLRILVKDGPAFRKWMARNKPGLDVEASSYADIYRVNNLSSGELNDLLCAEEVLFIDLGNRQAQDERVMDNSDLSVNRIAAVHAAYPSLNGEGLVLSLKEKPFDTTDVDLRGRMKIRELNKQPASLHATMMATLAVGAGNSAPKGLGVATGAGLISSSYDELMPDDHEVLLAEGVSVQNHSYGVGQIENYYGLEARQYDLETNKYDTLLHVFSSGNAGNATSETGAYAGLAGYANLTGQFKMSKNSLCVGEMYPDDSVKFISSKGPAYDGRVKPELVAFGDRGSSESAALVSGISLLVQEKYKTKYGRLPESALLKAFLIKSAKDIGRPAIDFEAGYGAVNALGAIKTVDEERFFSSEITADELVSFEIMVPEGMQELKLSLVWNDPAIEANAKSALVNDLDLELVNMSTKESWKPWVLNAYPHLDSITKDAIRGRDSLNNVEQVSVAVPKPGAYELRVRGKRIVTTKQQFHLVYQYESGFAWTYPVAGVKLESGDSIQLRWEWTSKAEELRMEYKLVGNTHWELIAEKVDASKESIRWRLPKFSGEMQLRIKTDESEYLSDKFVVSQPLPLSVGLNCEDECLLAWDPLEAADYYQVYQLGEQSLVPFKTTVDTFITINEEEKKHLYYAVAPVFNDKAGLRSYTINYSTQGTSCYYMSFLPKKFVNDEAVLNLELASLYRLESVSLEHYKDGAFRTVETISPVLEHQYSFMHKEAVTNHNLYRIKLERDDARLFYSQEEELFRTPAGSLALFPNPASPDSEINFIDGEDGAADIYVYGLDGSLVLAHKTDIGGLKVIPAGRLSSGLYVVEVRTESGYRIKTKLVVR